MAEGTPSDTSSNFRELRPATERVEAPSQESSSDRGKQASRKLPLTSEACDWCRQKKTKCSGPPRCQNCITRGRICTFNHHNAKRLVFTWEERETLQSRIRELEATISSLQTETNDEILLESFGYRPGSAAATDREGGKDVVEQGDRPFLSPSEGQGGSWASAANDNRSPSVDSTDSISTLQLGIVHRGNIPTEEAVRAAMSALGDTTADMFFIITAAESQRLLVQLYSKPRAEITKADICLVCAFCALGSHFVSTPTAGILKRSLFKTAWMLIDDCFETDVLQTLRALLCLALFSLLEKKSSARLMLASGLQIARGLEPNTTEYRQNEDQSESFRKIHRSFILLDSYLTTKIVYTSTVTSEEMDFVRISATGERVSHEDKFASGLITLALLMRTIPNNLYDSEEYKLSFISDFMQQLSGWQSTIPDEMQLTVLTAGELDEIPNSTRTAILYLHEAYLSAVVFLHRGLFPVLLEKKFSGQQWAFDVSAQSADECYTRTVITAQQCIRINSLLAHTASAVFRQCWLLLCEIFVCSCVLMMDTALSISMGLNDGADSLQSINDAMKTMEYMQSVEELASGCLATLRPIYGELEGLRKAKRKDVNPGGTHQAAGALLEKAVQIVRNINKHKSRQSLANTLASIRDPDSWLGLFS